MAHQKSSFDRMQNYITKGHMPRHYSLYSFIRLINNQVGLVKLGLSSPLAIHMWTQQSYDNGEPNEITVYHNADKGHILI